MYYIKELAIILIFFSFSSLFNVSMTQDGWTLISSDKKTDLDTRLSDESEIKEVKIEGTFSADITSVITALNDVNNYKKWVYKCVVSEKLDELDINQYKYYVQTDLPFPLDDRDLIVYTTQWIGKDNIWHSRSLAYPYFLPENDKLVRIKNSIPTGKLKKSMPIRSNSNILLL